ncbi:MAG: ABC transporter substrate-binding protein [Chloroflexi bacterium]|nr:ABC transporter substrate-binding protein [Chloroflexota bacterium]
MARSIPGLGTSSTSQSEPPCTVKIGIIHPLTGHPLTRSSASGAVELMRGYELARDEINAAGGINGCALQLVVKDDGDAPARARTAAVELADVERVPIILGSFSSDATLAAAGETNRRRVTLLVSNGVSPLITSLGYEWVFRIPADSAETVKTSFDFLAVFSKTLPAPTLAVVYEDRLQFVGTATGVVSEAEARGLSVVASEQFSASFSDLRQIVGRVRMANPDVLFLATDTVESALRLMRQIEALGWTPKLFLTTIGPFTYPEFAQNGRYAAYFVGTAQWAADVSWRDKDGRTAADFVRAYGERFGGTPGYRALQGYVSMDVAALALEQAFQHPASEVNFQVREALRGMNLQETLFGPIRFDHRGQNRHPVLLTQVIDGQFVTVYPEEHRVRPAVVPVPPWDQR